MRVTVIDTEIANIASIEAALARQGAIVSFAKGRSDIEDASAVLLPGVGAFAAGMERLRESDFDTALINRISFGKPTLGICLGMQLFCDASEESPGTKGLGIIPSQIRRFPDTVAVPHLGWNAVQSDIRGLEGGDAYFANSYCLPEVPVGWNICKALYGVEFVAAAKKGAVMITQFHPELSGQFGGQVLDLWLKEVGC